ncbi:tudor domain-containing protein 15 [Dromaius novaehollandiae]|uniref:Tudor domain containing 15 n=1 Tax=Dromaius novaehollandiae TaxID=8790 RepID=A0A8C4JPP8_DRONO|nr:tudor domain-containing protein 15 [Dromaius novaehollandiae]XP_025948129.1 tudor domain-containing protein 15 [Dromaius novaehollandiae]XP_025948130.1 tudor domain-containing protein 15 [Dromaius novaehollandiae]XP_025948131.1 tudor domain-containing protein 15 [Dromaius novaehollandiae]
MESLAPSPNTLDMHLKITCVECHPECLLVAFQGQYKDECEFDYNILQNEIERAFKVQDNVDICGSCLVEDTEGKWHRGKVLKKKENIYEVCLIDIGKVIMVDEIHIASACAELFQLPPKIVYGVFANVLPLGEKWGPKAVNYFSSLVGLQIAGHVKAVLPYQLYILEVSKVISDIVELQLGKLIDGDSFCLIVETLKALPQEMLCKQMPQLLKHKYAVQELLTFSDSEKPSYFHPVPGDLLPLLPVGSKENVKITVAISPNKFYCQIQKWQKELEDLTGAMHLYYEAISRDCNTSLGSLGLLCAARRQNGQWHRGVIQQFLADRVEVWFMDFGNIEAVPSSSVWKLKEEFMSLPMISFPCALSCFGNQDEAAIKLQLKEFMQALIGQTSVCVCIDLFNASKHLYYITLQNQKFGINNTFPEKLNETAALHVSPSDAKTTSTDVNYKTGDENHSSFKNYTRNKLTNCLTEYGSSFSSHCKRVGMKMNSSHVAFVVYVINPSNFWIQTKKCKNEFQALMKNIADVYNKCGTDDRVLKNPKPGLLCCARYSKDMRYYRGVVTEVLCVNVIVYFLDFGYTDTVPCCDVKTLLPEFSDLPALAMCCALACTFPMEDVWIKKETDFFKETVFNKPILLRVVGKQNSKYIVNAQCMNGLQECNVAMCMVQAGCAEYWEGRPESLLNLAKNSRVLNHQKFEKKKLGAQGSCNKHKNKISGNGQIFQKEKSLSVPPVLRESVVLSCFGRGAISQRHQLPPEENISYKEFVFKPGAFFEVVCSYIDSPADFSCQLQSKLPELNNLMEQIQIYYKVHTSPYKTGQAACVVKCSKDGRWYRATVVQQVSADEVDVVFVDFGNRERVLLKDIQGVLPDFLALESQAFRCSLKNGPLQINTLNWSEEVCRHFEDFISASRGPLICIIYALILVSPNCLYNIVDLQTPFISAEEFLRERGHTQSEYIRLRKCASLSSLYSFCYSSFNIKIGSEEEVYITHIHSPLKFYCQLNRNTETIDALMKKVSEISRMPNHAKYDSNTRLCIARYFEDGLFYRALAFPTESSSYLLVDFVDFGNKHMVERDELMPIPECATDLLLTPMQAIKCCLSNLKETEISIRVNRWFEETFLGKLLKAVIISREPDGQIVVELYDGQLQISQKIREKILEELAVVKNYTEQFVGSYRVVHHIENDKESEKLNVEDSERTHLRTEVERQVCDVYCQTNTGQNFVDEEQTARNTHDLCSKSSKLLTSQDSEEPGVRNGVGALLEHQEKPVDEKLPPHSLCQPPLNLKEVTANTVFESSTERLNCPGQQERSEKNTAKLTSLPQRDIQVNSEVAGYISHVNSPSSFHIHLAEEENLIIQLAEELNESTVNAGHEHDLGELMVGDVVLAEYSTDCFFYRAVIKTVKSENSFEVEFIDYGNTAVVSPSKIYRIETKFLTLPRLSIPCFLSRVKSTADESWTNKSISYFVREINNKPVTCKFLQQLGEWWEVDIICEGKSMSDVVLQKKHRTRLQNTSTHSPENTSKQILITNTASQYRGSRNNLGGQSRAKAVGTRNTSKTLLKVPLQDINPGQVETAEIINVSGCGKFCVKLLRNLQVLHDLNVMLVKEAEKNDLLAVDNIEEGLECITKSKRNLKWYRSKVMKKFSRERLMLVFFMDCGKCEMVSLNNAKMLSDEIKSIPKQAVPCKWVWFKNSNRILFVNLVNALLDHKIRILFLRYLESSHLWEVEILIGEILLLEYLNRLLIHDKTIAGPEKYSNIDCKAFATSFRINSVTWMLLQSGRWYPGFATTVTDPSNFCIQLEGSFQCMKNLSLLLSDLPDNLPALPKELVAPGAGCLIKLGLETEWNRAEISEVSSQFVVLTFIDYGFLKKIPYSDIHKLKVLPEDLAYLPRLAYSCCLCDTVPSKGEHWSEEAKLLFRKLLSKPGLMLCFKQYGSGMKLEVDVLYKQNNLACILVAAGHAVYSRSRCRLVPVGKIKSTKA